jgi:hypothetical protein
MKGDINNSGRNFSAERKVKSDFNMNKTLVKCESIVADTEKEKLEPDKKKMVAPIIDFKDPDDFLIYDL